jgi:DNA-binding NtrC family response regulator
MERLVALVADPDPAVRAEIRGVLDVREHAALETDDVKDVPRLLRDRPIDLLIIGAGNGGIDVSRLLQEFPEAVPVTVALTAEDDQSLDLIRAGAFDVLCKPLDRRSLQQVVERAVRQCSLLREWHRLRAELGGREGCDAIVGASASIERVRDVGLLARHFVATICEINKLPEVRLSTEALELLERYRWPTNMQGLRDAMEQAVILASDGAIQPGDLPEWIRGSEHGSPTSTPESANEPRSFREAKREVVERFERSYLAELMGHHRGNVTAASHRAGMLRSALQRLLRKYGLKSADFRTSSRARPTADRPHAE